MGEDCAFYLGNHREHRGTQRDTEADGTAFLALRIQETGVYLHSELSRAKGASGFPLMRCIFRTRFCGNMIEGVKIALF